MHQEYTYNWWYQFIGAPTKKNCLGHRPQVLVMISVVVIIAHNEVDCGVTVHNIA